VAGILNWEAQCKGHLAMFLVIYGGVGLLFVYLLFREWLYYARLSSLPTLSNMLLLVLFYCLLLTAGGFLSFYTWRSHTECHVSAPLLYRWCKAAVLFFAIIVLLFLVVPVVRVATRCLLAPFALCIIGCVETVGVDVEVGVAGQGDYGDEYGPAAQAAAAAANRAGSGMMSGMGKAPRAVESAAANAMSGAGSVMGRAAGGAAGGDRRKKIAGAAAAAPLMILCIPLLVILRPIGKLLGAVCTPCLMVFVGCLEALGCVSYDEGTMRFANPASRFSCPGCASALAQIALAPGCVVPGRSLIALFVNTAALLWFFLYLLYELYSSWGDTCAMRTVPGGVSFQQDPFLWLSHGAPSPIHWLLLLFGAAGVAVVSLTFIHDIFSGPKPPPRSYYEAALWRGRRQVKVVGVVLLFMAFVGWGIALCYYTFVGDDCVKQDRQLYNIALLLVLLLCVLVAIVLVLGCCVCLDCIISGRLRLILLLTNPSPPQPPPAGQYAAANAAAGDERLVPGVPLRDPTGPSGGSYGTGGYFVGVADDAGTRLCNDDSAPPAGSVASVWSTPGAKLPGPPRR